VLIQVCIHNPRSEEPRQLPVVMFTFFKILQVFTKGVDKDMVCLLAARASRTENQDAIDAAIVGVLADPKEVLHMLL
jgi:hypothetical protein